jgi:hypothetical protein
LYAYHFWDEQLSLVDALMNDDTALSHILSVTAVEGAVAQAMIHIVYLLFVLANIFPMASWQRLCMQVRTTT